ncbi:MAG: hypothetical protein HY744_07930 [Deltaproteobacteria bacterium]|nr:hypothetical protein [Deltaproteobacteria bacterium]
MSGAGRDLGRACGWLAVGLWAAAAGCNALLDIDHIEFRDLSVAAAGAAGAGGRGTGGSGGTGGGTGLAGGGGSGAGGGCVVAACPGVDTDCKHRICVEGQCGLLSDEKGKPCSHGRAPGYCDGEGECVECVHSGQCADGEICQQNQCVPKSCINGAPDPGETDVDCGGEKCPSCADGQKCQDPSDCQSKFCSEPGAGGNGGAGGANYCAPCQGEQDCALSPGTYCQGGKCVGKKAPGESCAAAAQCSSGFCPLQDGLCCNAACDGACQACRLDKSGQANGVCAPVAAGEDPDEECSAQGPQSCGADGSGCSGEAKGPGCRLYAKGTGCKAQSCTGGVLSAAGQCDGQGQCVPGQQSSCAPYGCDGQGKLCLTNCAQKQDCAGGHYCDGASKCVPEKAKGKSCAGDGQCATAHCADGFCCEVACSGSCEACDLPGLAGTCTLVPLGQNPGGKECAASQACDGAGACKTLAGKACQSGGECLSGFCPPQDELCCASACAGPCQACLAAKTGGKDGVCAALKGSTDPDKECPDLGAAQCKSNGSGCNGDALAPGCKLYGADVVCKAASCSGGVQTPAGKCDGKGGCTSGGQSACSPYTCNLAGTACLAQCGGDGDCAAGFYCWGGQCVKKKTSGQSCAGAKECQSGYCVDGLCCAGPCVGACDGCNLPAYEGSCKLRAKGSPGSPSCGAYLCSGQGAACPASCASDEDCATGYYCDQAKECVALKPDGAWCLSQHECLSAHCVDSYCCEQDCAGACDACNLGGGKGSCKPVAKGSAGSPSCAPYKCDGQSGACASSCASDGDCAGGYYCDEGNNCVPFKALGVACAQGKECLSGFCVDGYCCEQACAGACDGCNLMGYEGTCKLRGKGAGGSPSCAPYKCDGQSASCPKSCQEGGDCAGGYYCNGAKECKALEPDAAPCLGHHECQSAHCIDGYCCDGACAEPCDACNLGGKQGTCALVPQGAAGSPSCAPYRCGGQSGACASSCASDGDCAQGYYCDGANKCVPFKALGVACAQGKECLSGICVDGYCCDGACGGACDACNLGGKLGTCGPATTATRTRSACRRRALAPRAWAAVSAPAASAPTASAATRRAPGPATAASCRASRARASSSPRARRAARAARPTCATARAPPARRAAPATATARPRPTAARAASARRRRARAWPARRPRSA